MGSKATTVLIFLLFSCGATLAQTTYSKTCPNVESIIRDTVRDEHNSDKTMPAGLIRLHFHDCFVDGCDGSLLLTSTPTDGTDVERLAFGNMNSVRGFEVIDKIKTKLEAACPGVVTCADIVAMAARDSGVLMNGPYYTVPTGRFDGRRSNKTLANLRLPSPFFSFQNLTDNFKEKNLSVQDLVVLSGGHTLGRTKCAFFQDDRIYNFSLTGQPDPGLNRDYLPILRNVCTPRDANPSPSHPLDKDSEFTFDNEYYRNLLNKNGLLTSDVVLLEDTEASALVRALANNNSRFFELYAKSMINMGNVDWKSARNGEIRKTCSVVNGNSLITTKVGDITI